VLKGIVEHFYSQFLLFNGRISAFIENDVLSDLGKESIDLFVERYVKINCEDRGQFVASRYY